MDRSGAKARPDPVSAYLDRRYRLPAAVRVAISAIVLAAGIVFALSGLSILFSTGPNAIPLGIGAAALAAVLIAFGSLFLEVGWRVLQARSVGPGPRRAFALVFGIAAVGMMVQAWADDDIARAVQAIGSGFCAFLIVRSTVRT